MTNLSTRECENNTDETVFFGTFESRYLHIIYIYFMVKEYQDYSLLLKFFEKFSVSGIAEPYAHEPLMVELDKMMEKNRQMFYLADVMLLDMEFVHKRVRDMFGIEPEKVTAGYFLTTTHPDDLKRHHLIRVKLLSTAQEFYIKKGGKLIISSNVRAKNPGGGYTNMLYQAYAFYSKVPYESVFMILVHTDITGFDHIHKGFHIYVGDDTRLFRFPDKELLMMGSMFSQTEFRIIELVAEGLSAKEIADKLFRSVHTINTHRTNILEKSGKSSMAHVIRDLKGQGML